MKKLTRLQAWEKILEAFENYDKLPPLARFGLCYAIGKLVEDLEISFETYIKMERDIDLQSPNDTNFFLYFWPKDEEGAKQRVAAIKRIIENIKGGK